MTNDLIPSVPAAAAATGVTAAAAWISAGPAATAAAAWISTASVTAWKK